MPGCHFFFKKKETLICD
uniref:Uncharacterized protein n=1 Tax=Arundo donax TaxID=35708 RepID=A0A0A8Y372_ARUDO